MDTQAGDDSQLRQAISDGVFFDISDTEVLLLVKRTFPEELERLKNANVVEQRALTPDGDWCEVPPPRSPSQIMFNYDFDEINRTMLGILCMRWIVNNDYQRFTLGQPAQAKLRPESFDWLRTFFQQHLQRPADVFVLILSIVVNDLGKDPALSEDYFFKTGKALQGQNHDTILFEAARIGLIPCMDMLSEDSFSEVLLGLELGSELNAGQLAQAENVPINLEGLLSMRDHDHAFQLKFMEQILDVAGASGHRDARGSRNFIEPVFQSFKTVYEVSMEIISGKCDLRQGYDKVLTKRGDILTSKGFRRLSVSNSDERALLRLLTMGRTSTLDQAELFESAFEALEQENKTLLIHGLNIDGNPNETAVLPYYMPAMLAESLGSTRTMPRGKRIEALAAIMRYLARVLQSTSIETLQEIQEMPAGWLSELEPMEGGGFPGIVIERNMIKARDTISSDEFKMNPSILDELKIPTGQVMQRRRTSQSFRGSTSPPIHHRGGTL